MSQSGFIYAIGVEGTSTIKIGSTTKPVALRLASLQTGQPAPLVLLAHVRVDRQLSSIEKALHHLLKAAHHRGEWFVYEIDQQKLEFLVMAAKKILAIGIAMDIVALYIWLLGYVMVPEKPIHPCTRPGTRELISCDER